MAFNSCKEISLIYYKFMFQGIQLEIMVLNIHDKSD